MSRIPVQRTEPQPQSLTQAGPNPSGCCPECGSHRQTALSMTLTDGTPVLFSSCHECEHRSWNHDGEALSFDDVIARTTKAKAHVA